MLDLRFSEFDPQQTFLAPANAQLRHGFCILSLSFAGQTTARPRPVSALPILTATRGAALYCQWDSRWQRR